MSFLYRGDFQVWSLDQQGLYDLGKCYRYKSWFHLWPVGLETLGLGSEHVFSQALRMFPMHTQVWEQTTLWLPITPVLVARSVSFLMEHCGFSDLASLLTPGIPSTQWLTLKKILQWLPLHPWNKTPILGTSQRPYMIWTLSSLQFPLFSYPAQPLPSLSPQTLVHLPGCFSLSQTKDLWVLLPRMKWSPSRSLHIWGLFIV